MIQGRVSDEENDFIVVQQTESGYTMLARQTSHDWSPGLRSSDITEVFIAELPGVPPELFYCLDLSQFLAKATIQEPLETNQSSIVQTALATITPISYPTPGPEKDILVRYTRYPGDGDGCMADYLGYSSPTYTLYADGQLLIENPHREEFWYTEYQLSQNEITDLLIRLENSGLFSVIGDGSEY